jgi:hypothetical protein
MWRVSRGRVAYRPKAGEIAINIRPTIPEAPQAVAYHMVTGGIPDIEVGLDNVDSLTSGSDSLLCAITHEVGETMGDPGANRLAELQDGSGKARYLEISDRVQNTTYKTADGGDTSNFLLPSAFTPGASGPWDFVSLTTGQSIMSSQLDFSNGYDVEATVSNDTQLSEVLSARRGHNPVVLGKENLSPKARNRKAHYFSRATRRGAKF